MSFKLNKLPNIFILYGPPTAGKGTQATFLKTLLPDFYHLDFGTELRKFVSENLGQYYNSEETANPDSDNEKLEIARRIKSDMQNNLPVQTADLRYVIESRIVECVEKKQGMIIEGPGRLVEEAHWLSAFFADQACDVVIFHLYISLDQALKRVETRYYLASTGQSYMSLEQATSFATDSEKPYRRPEDNDIEGTKQRYRLLYADNFAKIISIYQHKSQALVLTVDASKPIDEVSEDITAYIHLFFTEGKNI